VNLAVDTGRAKGDVASICTVLGRRARYDRSTDDVTIVTLLVEPPYAPSLVATQC
jgi:hypothetical protein